MREYGRVESGFWQNLKVRAMGKDARARDLKLLLLYLYACPHGNSVGCFVLPAGYIVADLEFDAPTTAELLAELVARGFIERDDASGLTRIVGWFGHNKIENGNVARAAMRAAEQLPSGSIKDNLFQELRTLSNKHIEGVWNEFRKSPEAVPKVSEGLRKQEPSRARAEPEPEPSPGRPDAVATAAPRADADAVRIRQAIVALFGETEVTIGWHWSEIGMLLQAGYGEAEIMRAADRTKARGVVPKKLSSYLRPIMDELRMGAKPAPSKPIPDYSKF